MVSCKQDYANDGQCATHRDTSQRERWEPIGFPEHRNRNSDGNKRIDDC
jgi:hypothetical protein